MGRRTAKQAQPFAEIGQTGLARSGGFVQEEFLRQLQGARGMKVYREMRDNDPIVGAMLFAVEHLARQVSWRVEPGGAGAEDLAAAHLVQSSLHDMSSTWPDTLAEILSMLPFGWAWLEIVYKRREGEQEDPARRSRFQDGRIGWRKWPLRAQESLLRWEFDAEGGVRAMVQQTPTDFRAVSIPIEKSLLFRTSVHKGNPEGRSLLRNSYRCFASDTELLTRRGWQPVSAVTTTDFVATLNAAGEIEYQRPDAVWKYPYVGDLVHARSRFVDQLVTPTHRMWVRRDHKDSAEFVEAGECPATVSFLATGAWPARDLATVAVGQHAVPADDWFSFLGLWLAQGHSWSNGVRHEVGITQKPGSKADAIRGLISRLPWPAYERRDRCGTLRWTFTRWELWRHFAPLGKAKTKRMPRYALEASARQLDLLLHWYFLGDGTRVGGRVRGRRAYPGTRLLFTASPRLADDLQEAAFKAGYRTTLRRLGGARLGGPVWAVTLGKPFPRMRATWSVVPYDGPVYCVTTSNGVVCCRRNGKASWSGNSWYFKRRIEEIEAIGIERDLAGLPVLTPPEGLDIWNPNDANAAALKAAAEKIVKSVRRDEQEGVLKPHGWELELLSTGGRRQFETSEIINRYDQRIAMSILADFILIGHERVGSFALTSSKTHLFAVALGSFLDSIAEVVNRHAIPRLLALNGLRVERPPVLVHGDVETPDLAEVAAYVQSLALSGAALFPDPALERHLRQLANFPQAEGEGPDLVKRREQEGLLERERLEFYESVRKIRAAAEKVLGNGGPEGQVPAPAPAPPAQAVPPVGAEEVAAGLREFGERLKEGMGELAASLAGRPGERAEAPAPQVTVEAPVVNVSAPEAAPPVVNVTVPPQEPVPAPAPARVVVAVERDEFGRIVRVVEEPGEAGP